MYTFNKSLCYSVCSGNRRVMNVKEKESQKRFIIFP